MIFLSVLCLYGGDRFTTLSRCPVLVEYFFWLVLHIYLEILLLRICLVLEENFEEPKKNCNSNLIIQKSCIIEISVLTFLLKFLYVALSKKEYSQCIFCMYWAYFFSEFPRIHISRSKK